MNEFLIIAGILLTLLSLMEALWTTLWIDGNSPPVTSRITTLIWKFFKSIFKRKNDKWLSLAGPAILLITVLFWIVSLWIGWSLIFYGYPESIVVKSTGLQPDYSDALWYIAYTMFTVGNGDFNPQGDFWQILSSLVAFSGMALVTLSITYVLQVISAVTNKRAFSSQITSIGKTPEEFVSKQWTGKDFGAIELQLNTLSQQLAVLNEQHLAFPILHYYHAANEQKSQDMAIAILDDALTLIDLGVQEQHKPAETILISARASVKSFLETVKMAFIKPADETPEKPDLSPLKEKRIPLVSDEEFYRKLEQEEPRRKLILGLINNGAWHWPSASKK